MEPTPPTENGPNITNEARNVADDPDASNAIHDPASNGEILMYKHQLSLERNIFSKY